MPYTDLFNEAIDDLANSLSTITGLRVVTDPRKINPPCVFIDAPTFTAYNANIADMTFPVQVISIGPANMDALRNVLSICAELLVQNVAVTDGKPITLSIGGQDLSAYDLTVRMKVQAS
jgi:hypothetical protein